ncbi:proline iminopeptidase [Longispora fulva]|uniref:Proline iminopeptidase n=1 Tax=Longispora fulva TaxID=619741 RepID=A0A8J7GLE8_9ACTN|nr:alpha/beta hydrolase [Longispora fulva]MBG6141834.1 proline iminopeptidase [Longispora fulva]GIG59011.1 proline iminopeptidase [Longispora fulva]
MLLDIGTTRLFVDDRGPKTAPTVVYVHGGPGHGSYEFMTYQGELLSRHLRIIALDQRGVLRSDPLDTTGTLSEHDLVDDLEAVRRTLAIDTWTVVGQSHGGRIALRYALAHPETVTGVVFENPGWDLVSAMACLRRAAIPVLRELGHHAEAERAEARLRPGAAVDGPRPSADPARGLHDPDLPDALPRLPADRADWLEFVRTLGLLGDRRNEIYVHQAAAAARMAACLDSAPFTRDTWTRAGTHFDQISAHPSLYESLVPLLGELTHPALLIKGRHDNVTAPADVAAFRASVPHGRTEMFDDSGHFAHLEEPDRYADTLTSFIRR